MVKELLHGIDTILKPFHDARVVRDEMADQVRQRQTDGHAHTAVLADTDRARGGADKVDDKSTTK